MVRKFTVTDLRELYKKYQKEKKHLREWLSEVWFELFLEFIDKDE